MIDGTEKFSVGTWASLRMMPKRH